MANEDVSGMYVPNLTRSHTTLPGWQRTFVEGRLTLGVSFPIEYHEGDTPRMDGQAELARIAEAGGVAALWARDVPMRDPSFGDTGQVFDPFTFLSYIAALTDRIALGTAGIVLPLHHPVHLAKQAASLDRLSGGRFLMGIASGDRPQEYPVFGLDHNDRAEVFRENLAVMTEAWRKHYKPITWSRGRVYALDMVPKPLAAEVPLLFTGSCQQDIDWLAAHGHGWLTYPRGLERQRSNVEKYRKEVAKATRSGTKPVGQALGIDLTEDPETGAVALHMGYRLGHRRLIDMLHQLEDIGINHVMMSFRGARRGARVNLEEIIEHVIPHFPSGE